jgi:hypothetical protein
MKPWWDNPEYHSATVDNKIAAWAEHCRAIEQQLERVSEVVGAVDAERVVPPEVLLDAAQLLDDCLIQIYPEEFLPKHIEASAQRFSDGGGIIGRIATMTDKLRQAANGGSNPTGEP